MPRIFKMLKACRKAISDLIKGPKRRARKTRWEQLLEGSPEDRFTKIYRSRAWSSKESLSGTGSELRYTQGLRAALPALFTDFGVSSVLDAPCGDFNWMRHVVAETGITYVGGDIVQDLIKRNQMEFCGERIRFVHMDITSDALPAADLMIVRDCLFHLCYTDIAKFLANFAASDIPYLLTSTHVRQEVNNRDILTGDFRFIDLFTEPFCFPKGCLRAIDDFVEGHAPRQMCLFDREQVTSAADNIRRFVG
jgi:hypothetical protein